MRDIYISMQATAAGYASTYCTTLNWQLINCLVVGLTECCQSQIQSQSYFMAGGLPPNHIYIYIYLRPRETVKKMEWNRNRPLGIIHDEEEDIYLRLEPSSHGPHVTSSMLSERVCLFWIWSAFCQEFAHMACHWQSFLLHYIYIYIYIYKSSGSPGFAKHIMPILLILCYNGKLSHLKLL
jgi:hypothetical protein